MQLLTSVDMSVKSLRLFVELLNVNKVSLQKFEKILILHHVVRLYSCIHSDSATKRIYPTRWRWQLHLR